MLYILTGGPDLIVMQWKNTFSWSWKYLFIEMKLEEKLSTWPFGEETVHSHSLYSGHCRDLKLSSLARVHNSGRLF